MLKLLRLEFLKLRRTLVWPVVLGLPVIPALINLRWFTSAGFQGRDWADPLFAAEFTWFLLLGPLSLHLLAAQVFGLEETSGGWRLQLAAPRPRNEGLWAKIILLLLLCLLMLSIMGVSAALGSYALPLTGQPNWTQFAGDLLRGGLALLGLLGVCIWLALHFRTFLMPLGLGALGAMLAFGFISQPLLGRWWPWSLPFFAAQSPTEQTWSMLYATLVGLACFALAFWETKKLEA